MPLEEPLYDGSPDIENFFYGYPYGDTGSLYEYQTDYIDNIEVASNDNQAVSLTMISQAYNNEGYIQNPSSPVYYYYRRDHLGNNREVWCANTNSTVQRTQYYPSGLPMAYNPGDNPGLQKRKYNGKEFVEMHGLEASDLGWRSLHHAKMRFETMDRFSEKYPWQSPYCFASNNPIMNIDIQGDSAWSVKREWNESDQKGFAEYAEKRLKEYEGKKSDCADLALSVIIDYASKNGLALQISTADGKTFDSNSDNYNSIGDFKYGYKEDGEKGLQGGVLPNVQAKDISSNTFTLSKKDAQTGDMIILTKPFDHIANYSQIKPNRKLTYGNLDGGKPGNVSTTPDWSNSPVDGRNRPMVYNPNRKMVHRWKVLDF